MSNVCLLLFLFCCSGFFFLVSLDELFLPVLISLKHSRRVCMTKSLSACSSSVAVVNSKIIASSYKPCSFCTGLNMLLAGGSSQPQC